MTGTVTESIALLSIHADACETRRASMWLGTTGREHGVPEDEIRRLDHCLDEALANIIAHGGAGARTAPIVLRFEFRRGPNSGEAAVTVTDAGAAFDPLGVPARPVPKMLADANPGGLGLLLIRSFADSLGYRFGDFRNHLTFTVRWSEAR